MAKFDDAMDGTFDLYPLRVVYTGLEAGKAETRRAKGERCASEDVDLRVADNGAKASRSADAPHVHQGSGKEMRRLLGRLTDKDAAGRVVKEDRRISGAEVRIEVGNDPLQVDRIRASGFFVGQGVRCARGGERWEIALLRRRCN